MKKLVLTALVAGSLLATSCKKGKEAADKAANATTEVVKVAADKAGDVAKGATEKVADAAKGAVDSAAKAVESAVAGIALPKFADDKVNAYVKEYADYAKNYIDVKGDVLKNPNLAKKGVELAEKSKDILKGLAGDEKTKFTNLMSSFAAKMAPKK